MNTIIFSIYTNTEMLVIFISRKTMFCFKKYNTESKKTHPKLNNKNKKYKYFKENIEIQTYVYNVNHFVSGRRPFVIRHKIFLCYAKHSYSFTSIEGVRRG